VNVGVSRVTVDEAAARPGFLASTLAVARKELVSGMRDRQTTLYTLVLPILLYPFLFWAMIQGSLFVEGRREHTEVEIGVAARDADLEPAGLAEFLERPESGTPEGDGAPLNRIRVLSQRAPLSEEAARAWLASRAQPGSARGPDAVLYLASDEDGERTGAKILYDSSNPRSQIALARLQARMPGFVRDLRVKAADVSGRTEPALEPFRREVSRDIAPPKARGAYILSLILPLLFVIMAVIGAFFPAVDMTCGERERKTAETTMLLPVPRNAVHLGKILAVCVAALVATTLNLSALGLSAEHLLRMFRGAAVRVDLPVRAFVQAAPLLLLFAFFVSSILTGVAALARTFKEGQALLGPVQILFVVPAMAGTLPGIQLSPALAGIPVVNVVLCFKSLLRGESIALPYAITACSLAALSVAAIGLSVWTLSRESLLVAEGGTALSRFRGLFRSPRGTR
jgi:sodium transport system permease protein